ncbi:hypothetical protein PMAYCL1PPCAC_13365, partial [Pristionchus mayeri]
LVACLLSARSMRQLEPAVLYALLYCTGSIVLFSFSIFAVGYGLRRAAVKGHMKNEPGITTIIKRKERLDSARKKADEAKKEDKKSDPPRSDPPAPPPKPKFAEKAEESKTSRVSSANTISRESTIEPTLSERVRRFRRQNIPVFYVNYTTEHERLKGAPNLAKTEDTQLKERQRAWKMDND